MRSLTRTTTTTAARCSCGSPSCWSSCSASAPSSSTSARSTPSGASSRTAPTPRALAVAADCAEGDCLRRGRRRADTYADANANDGAANVDEVCGSGPGLADLRDAAARHRRRDRLGQGDHVDPQPGERQPDPGQVPPRAGARRRQRRRDRARLGGRRLGPVGGATTIPFTFSVCEFEHSAARSTALTFPNDAELHLLPRRPARAGSTTARAIPRVRTCPAASAGSDSTSCEADRRRRRLGRRATPATAVAGGCDPDDVAERREVLIPLYNETTWHRQRTPSTTSSASSASRCSATSSATTTAAEHAMATDSDCPDTSGQDVRCFYGKFTRVTTTPATSAAAPTSAPAPSP